MSGGGGGSKSTTTVQKADPWSGVQDDLRAGYNSLASLYGRPDFNKKGEITGFALGPGPQYYPNQTVVNPNALEGAGQDWQLQSLYGATDMANRAQSGIGGLFGAQGQTQGGLGGAYQGMNSLLNAANQTQGGLGLAQAGAGNLLGYAQSHNARAGEAGAVAGMQGLLQAGDPSNNPYFQNALSSALRPVQQQFSEQIMPAIRRGAVGAGQAGGSRQGIAEGIAGRGALDTMGDIATNMGNQAYGQGLQAMQAGAGIGQGLLGMGLESAGQAANIGQGIYGQGLGAAGTAGSLGSNLFDTGLTSAGRAAALAPQVQQMGLMPGQTAERIGQQRTADQQAQVDADMARWNYGQQLPYSQMSDYLQLLQGAQGGTTASSMSAPQTGSMFGRIGGGALAGYGMTGNPWGALAGGMLGLF